MDRVCCITTFLSSLIAFKWKAIKSYHRRCAIFVRLIDMHRDVDSTVTSHAICEQSRKNGCHISKRFKMQRERFQILSIKLIKRQNKTIEKCKDINHKDINHLRKVISAFRRRLIRDSLYSFNYYSNNNNNEKQFQFFNLCFFVVRF